MGAAAVAAVVQDAAHIQQNELDLEKGNRNIPHTSPAVFAEEAGHTIVHVDRDSVKRLLRRENSIEGCGKRVDMDVACAL